MDGVLSQDEINALINGGGDSSGSEGGNEPEDTSAEGGGGNTLTEDEKDAIGEISNISMGSAATTLFALVNRKVEISTPIVSYSTWNDIEEDYERPCVFIRIAYTVGLDRDGEVAEQSFIEQLAEKIIGKFSFGELCLVFSIVFVSMQHLIMDHMLFLWE